MEELIIITITIIIIITIFFFKITKTNKTQYKNPPPSPPSYPIIGHLHLLTKQPIHRALQKLSTQYGDVFSLQFGSRHVAIISSPSAVEECFTKNDIVLANRPLLIMGKHVGYNYTNIVNAPYGHHWRNLRRIATVEILSSTRLNLFLDIRKDEILRLLRQFSGAGGGWSRVELRSKLTEMSFNIIMRMMAGKRYYGDDVAEEGRRFREVMKAVLENAGAENPADFLPVLKWIPINNYEKRVERLGKKADLFLQGLIEEHRNRKDGGDRNTVIDHLLTLQESQPEYYSDQIIKGFVLYSCDPILCFDFMDHLLHDMNHTLHLTESEREVLTLPTGLNTGNTSHSTHVLYARVISSRDINRKTFRIKMSGFWKGQYPVTIADHHSGLFLVTFGCLGDLKKVFLLEPWHFQNHLIVLSSPTALQSPTPEAMSLTPFWIQLHRLPFLSKTKAMAEWAGNLLGTYVDVHEDSLNEGWGPFLRFRAILDISKPLLRGKMVKLKDSLDEFWLEFRYERLPEFCFECGTIGHPFESCHKFLELIYNGNDPSLEYGPAMIGSPLPDSGYDRYRTDFFKGGAWPLMTRLAKNSFTAAIPKLSRIPLPLPPNMTNRESLSSPSTQSSSHITTFITPPITLPVTTSISCTLPVPEVPVIPFPSYLPITPMIATYPPNSTSVKSFSRTPFAPAISPKTTATYSTIVSSHASATLHSPSANDKGKAILDSDDDLENINPNKQFKRQLDSESLRNVLKRCRSNAIHIQSDSSAPNGNRTALYVSNAGNLDSEESQSDVSAVVALQHRAQP